MTTLRAELPAALERTSQASPIRAKVNQWVPVFSAGMQPPAAIFSSAGMDTVSTRPR
jgi:hypothetical protein